MGFLDIVKQTVDGLIEIREENKREAEKEKKKEKDLTMINNMKFTPFDEDQIELAESVRAGLFVKGDKKKLVESMKNGTAGYLPVEVLEDTYYFDCRGETSREHRFGKVRTKDGVEVKGYIYIPGGIRFFTAKDYDDFDINDKGEAVISGEQIKPKPGYVVKYFIGKREQYALVDKKNFKSLAFIGEEPWHYMANVVDKSGFTILE